MKVSGQILALVAGAALMLAGVVVLRVNPPLPRHFGGSFGPNIQDLSAFADRVASGAVGVGGGLILAALVGPPLWELARLIRPHGVGNDRRQANDPSTTLF